MQFNETFMFAAVICVVVIWLLYNSNCNIDTSSTCPDGICEIKNQDKCSDKNQNTKKNNCTDKNQNTKKNNCTDKEVEPQLDLTDLPKEYPGIYLPDMQEDSNSYSYPVATR